MKVVPRDAPDLARVPAPWERRPDENDLAWERFQRARAVEPPRSRAKVAAALGVTVYALNHVWKAREWTSRLRAWDAHVARRADEATLDGVEKLAARQVKQLEGIQAKMIRALAAKAVEEIDAIGAGRLWIEAARFQRTLIGEAEARTETVVQLMRGPIDVGLLTQREREELAVLLQDERIARVAELLAKARRE